MLCFAGVFLYCTRGLGASDEPGGPCCSVRTECRSLRDAFLRLADADIQIARASRALGRVALGSRLARIHLEARESP